MSSERMFITGGTEEQRLDYAINIEQSKGLPYAPLDELRDSVPNGNIYDTRWVSAAAITDVDDIDRASIMESGAEVIIFDRPPATETGIIMALRYVIARRRLDRLIVRRYDRPPGAHKL